MDVSGLMVSTNPTYQDFRFNEFIETHIPYLIANYITNSITPTADRAAKFKGDLYGLFSDYNIAFNQHYINMRANGFYNSADYDGSVISLLIVDPNQCDALMGIYKSYLKN